MCPVRRFPSDSTRFSSSGLSENNHNHQAGRKEAKQNMIMKKKKKKKKKEKEKEKKKKNQKNSPEDSLNEQKTKNCMFFR